MNSKVGQVENFCPDCIFVQLAQVENHFAQLFEKEICR